MNARVAAGLPAIPIQTYARKHDMAKRDELLDISMHALTALMNSRKSANIDELVDESVTIARKLMDKVEKEIEGK